MIMNLLKYFILTHIWLGWLTLQENVTLINELNALRKELKDIRGALSDLESAMGFHRRNQKMSTAEILRLIASSTKNAQMERELDERRQITGLQTFEMQKLRNQLCVSERQTDAMLATSAKIMGGISRKPASANDAALWPVTDEEPGFFPPVDWPK